MSEPKVDGAELLRAALARHGNAALLQVARGAGAAAREYVEGPEGAELRQLATLVDTAAGGTLSRLLGELGRGRDD